MNKKATVLMLATAALLASCSQDDALQNTVNTMKPLRAATCRYSMAMARNWKAAIPNP